MIAAGASAEVIVAAVKASQAAEQARKEAKRVNNAVRQQRFRDKNNASNALRDVTGVTPPSLDKETSPRPPKEINPTPRVGSALARKAAGFGPPENIEVQMWNEFCSQRKKPLTPIAYAAITKTLTEAAQVGWPPGEVISRSIASGWETVFVPKDQFNGSNRQSGFQRPQRVDGFTAALRQVAGSQAPDRDAYHRR